MPITLDITPEVKAALARQAAAEGREVESYAASLLEQAVHPTPAHPTPPANPGFSPRPGGGGRAGLYRLRKKVPVLSS